MDHRRGVQLTAVELESSDTTQIGSLPAFGDVPQDLAADQIVPDEWNPDSVVADGPGSFVEIFRSSTPYIKMHRASTMVIHIDTRVLDEERLLADLMDDVALITVLGVMPVLVISIRDQVDARLREMGVEPRFHGVHLFVYVYVHAEPSLPQYMHIEPRSHRARRPSTVDRALTPRKSGPEPYRAARLASDPPLAPSPPAGGLRISDPVVIRVLQEVSGFARSRVEAALSRGRGSRGAGGVSVGVVGGNLFYTAQPLGVRDGVDLGSTGEVRWASGGPRRACMCTCACTCMCMRMCTCMRTYTQVRRVEVDKIRTHLNSGEIVLLGALGYSASGDVFNVKSEEVAW